MSETEQSPAILLIGDILSGFYAVGPFPDWAAAQSYADDQHDPYVIVDLDVPEDPPGEEWAWTEDEE